MQKKTVARLITEIKANYRYTYRDMSEEEMRLMAERWYDCLEMFTDEQVENAFRVALSKQSVPPTIADIVGIITRSQRLRGKSDMALWTEVMRGVNKIQAMTWNASNGFIAIWEERGESAKKAYSELSEIIRSYLDFENFCEYGGYTSYQLQMERSRFLKAMPELREAFLERKYAVRELHAENKPLIGMRSKI